MRSESDCGWVNKGEVLCGEAGPEGERDDELLNAWRVHLVERELAPSTVVRYELEARRFCRWLAGQVGGGSARLGAVSKKTLLAYRTWLLSSLSPSGANVAVAAINSLCSFMGRGDLRIKPPRIQRGGLRPLEVNLSYGEYKRLAKAGERIAGGRAGLVIQSLCASGLRVSELPFLTVEASQAGAMWVANKGKVRQVLLPRGLCALLQTFCRKAGLVKGPVFVDAHGAPLSRSTIWRWIKAAAALAGVSPKKAYPHNLRHLFAARYYEGYRDLDAVSDALGHSKLETTRIYIAATAVERRAQIESLGLVLNSEGKTAESSCVATE